MEKYKIEKDSVQETLIIPLYGRRLCSRRFPGLYQDTTAAMLMEKVDYDFSPLERQANGLMQTFGALEVAMRQNDLAWEVQDYLNAHPRAAVINLGCGLDNTGRPDSAVRREKLLHRLGLPQHMNSKDLLAMLNALHTPDEVAQMVEELEQSKEE